MNECFSKRHLFCRERVNRIRSGMLDTGLELAMRRPCLTPFLPSTRPRLLPLFLSLVPLSQLSA